jgi:urease accessory protein
MTAEPAIDQAWPKSRWLGKLDLEFKRAENRTVLSGRRHFGPLRVQKPLYPEGPAVCHVVVVHPPGGVADKDDLRIRLALQPGAHAVLTTPGATKWYKASEGSTFRVEVESLAGAILEWLPNENIYFCGTSAQTDLRIRLADGATALGWDINVLGRTASGESWSSGQIQQHIEIVRDDGIPFWAERSSLPADSSIRLSRQGLAEYPVFGTFWCAGGDRESATIENLAIDLPFDSNLRAGVSRLPNNLLLIRAVGHRIEPLRSLLIHCWSRIRPMAIHRNAQPLRLWST